MNTEQITTLTAAGESERLEFKETTGTRREAARTVCAFLNQEGGRVLFGVTRDGGVVGQQVGERTIEELSAELRQIDPPAFPTVERVPVDGGREVIVISTGRGPTRPYIYRGNAYRRVGNTTLALSPEEYNRMLFERMHSEQRWETSLPPDGRSATSTKRRFDGLLRRAFGAVAWMNRRAGSRPTCCEDSVCCTTAYCFEPQPSCSATGKDWRSKFRNASYAWPASGEPTR